MSSFVTASIVGHVVKPPTQTAFPSGNKVTTLTVAVNTRIRNNQAAGGPTEQTEFYKIEIWGKPADVAHNYIAKGNQITASGKLTIDRWQDREGRERYTPTITATQFSLPPRSANAHSTSYTPSDRSEFASETDKEIDSFQMTDEEEAAAAEALFGTKQ